MRSLAFCVALVLSAASARAEVLTTMVDNGPSSNRVDIVFLGDGYTQADHNAGTYTTHIDGYLSHMFTPGLLADPFPRYRDFFNVHRIDVVSNQSGADRPQHGIVRDTALDASYRWDGVTDRLLYVDHTKTVNVMNSTLAGTGITPDMRLVTVNDSTYGGGGGHFAVYAGGNSSAHEIALHELGHSFSNLADEYGGPGVYLFGEPFEVNVTTDPTGAKWSHWHGYDQPGIGTIGSYEGGRYYDQGIYRPSNNSKMRSLNQAFDAISREKMILDIYDLVDPLDGWTDNVSLVVDAVLAVTPIDDDVIDFEWFVDGNLVLGAIADTFDLRAWGFGPGDYTVRVRAFDPTGFDPIDGWVRVGQSELEQFVTWNVRVTPAAVPEPGAMLLTGVALAGLGAWGRRRRAAA